MRSCCSHPERVSSGGLNEGGQCMAPTPQHIPEPVHPPTPERDAVLGLGEKRAHAWRCSGGTCMGSQGVWRYGRVGSMWVHVGQQQQTTRATTKYWSAY